MSYKNAEGYKDPTVGAVLAKEMKEFRQAQRQKYQDKNRCKVYVASAYAGDTAGNTARAVQYCRFAIEKGYLPIASHLLYPQAHARPERRPRAPGDTGGGWRSEDSPSQ